MEDTLAAYARARAAKAVVHEQDYIDHYDLPLQQRIRARVVGDSYCAYQRRKAAMIRCIDHDAVPRIRVSRAGLRDPTDKFTERRVAEGRLSQFVNCEERAPRPPRVATLDYHVVDVSHQTRFFLGGGNQRGRRVYPGTGESGVGRELDAFEGGGLRPRGHCD